MSSVTTLGIHTDLCDILGIRTTSRILKQSRHHARSLRDIKPGVRIRISFDTDNQPEHVDRQQIFAFKEINKTKLDINESLKSLGTIDIAALRALIERQEEAAWHEQEHRQQAYDVHRYTESIVMIFTDGSGWPDIEVSKQPGWDRLAEAAVPIMHEIVDKHYPEGGTIIRAMAAKLLSGGKIKPHRDTHPSFHHGHRIHVPITTNTRVRFMIDGKPYKLQVGQAYEVNNQLMHSVMNKGSEDRITFIFDYVPPQLIDRSAG